MLSVCIALCTATFDTVPFCLTRSVSVSARAYVVDDDWRRLNNAKLACGRCVSWRRRLAPRAPFPLVIFSREAADVHAR